MEACNDVAQLLGDVDAANHKGRRYAYMLLTISHSASIVSSVYHGVATKLLSIVGVLPLLQELLQTTPDQPLFGLKQIEILSQRILSCRGVFERINKVVEEANNHVMPCAESTNKGAVSYFDSFPKSQVDETESTLDLCIRAFTVAVSAARSEYLSRRGYLTDDETFEGLHLREALKHSDYNRIPELVDSPPLPSPRAAPASGPTNTAVPMALPLLFAKPPSPTPIQSFAREIIELQHPRGFRGRYGHPDYPLLHKQAYVNLSPPDSDLHFEESFEEAEVKRYKLRAQGRYPHISWFGIWPPTFIQPNSIQDHQIRHLMPDDNKCKDSLSPMGSSVSTPVDTPNVTRDSTPTADGDNNTVVGAPESKDTKRVSKPTLRGRPDNAISDSTPKTPQEKTASSMKQSTLASSWPAASKSTISNMPSFKPLFDSTTNAAPFSSSHTSDLFTIGGVSVSAQDIDKREEHHEKPRFVFGQTASFLPSPSALLTYLEAYILRPVCEDVYTAIEWKYRIEKLPLEKEEIQAHLRKLGPNYSVIDSIGELHPEQLRLIQFRIKNRQGYLVAVQFGTHVDMVTKMGTFQVRSVLFILKTSLLPEKEEKELKKAAPLFGNPAPHTSSFNGFGNQPAFGTRNTSLFGDSAPQPGTFGVFGTRIPDPESFVQQHRQRLQENGEKCTHVERNSAGNNLWNLDHFQAITPTMRKDVSFEEIRVADIAAGRSSSMKTNGFSYPRDVPTSGTLYSGNLFGGKSSDIASESTVQGQQSRDQQRASGLFGTLSSGGSGISLPIRPDGLFGGPRMSKPSLFSSLGESPPLKKDVIGPLFSDIGGRIQDTSTATSNVEAIGCNQPATHASISRLPHSSSPFIGMFSNPSGMPSIIPSGPTASDSKVGLFGATKENSTIQHHFAPSQPSSSLKPSLFGDFFSSSVKKPTSSFFGAVITPGSAKPGSDTTATTSPPSLFKHINSHMASGNKCKTCTTDLIFHNENERDAQLCDACDEKSSTTCSICDLRIKTGRSGKALYCGDQRPPHVNVPSTCKTIEPVTESNSVLNGQKEALWKSHPDSKSNTKHQAHTPTPSRPTKGTAKAKVDPTVGRLVEPGKEVVKHEAKSDGSDGDVDIEDEIDPYDAMIKARRTNEQNDQ